MIGDVLKQVRLFKRGYMINDDNNSNNIYLDVHTLQWLKWKRQKRGFMIYLFKQGYMINDNENEAENEK